MRNDFIGTSIDGDRAACCNGSHNNKGNTINTAGNGFGGARQNRCGCDNRQSRGNGCGCNNDRQSRNNCGCDNDRQSRNNCGCDNDRQSRNNCGCDNDRQSRNNCGCDNDRQSRSNCGCDNDRQSHNDDYGYDSACKSCGCNGRTPGMVYAQHHELDNMYCAEKALLRGTLFACLDKPMCNMGCPDDACTSQCQEDKFTIWELRLYLNTHPCDKEALAMLRSLTEKMDEDCGCAFKSDCGRWSWLDGPWPWEYQRCCGKEA